MTKKNSLLAAIGVLSLCTIYAFTHPESVRERVLPIIFPENKPAVAPVYPIAPVAETNNRPEKTTAVDTLPPLEERYDDFINNGKKNPIDLQDPKAITQDVTFDPVTNMYIITEKIGDEFYRAPTYMTFDEYVKWRDKKQQQEYFDRLNGVASASRRNADGTEDPIAKFDIKNSLIDRLFGGTNVDIKPQGNINLTFGYDYQKIQNPILTLRQQRNGNFDFDMDINMSAQGKIGEKLNLNFNYNTQATFDFDNQMKIHYDPKGFSEDEIIQNIEAGNVSLPLRSNLIKGVQNLFGVKTEFKTGHLRTTFVAAQQRSRQQSLSIQGGAQVQTFEKPIDEYDENRHFFLSHWNRDQFEPSLKCLPVPLSLFTITRMEVWITNDKGVTENKRDIVSLTDLAEPNPFLDGKTDSLYSLNPVPNVKSPTPPKVDIKNNPLPDNGNNELYKDILSDLQDNPEYRYTDRVVNYLNSKNYKQIRDFEKVNARLLSTSEYTYNEQLGFVSVNLNVQPDQVVGVAVEYTYNGTPYKIGEFSSDIPKNADTINNPVLFVKMLKSTTANVRYPIWDLMMKNIYAVGTANVDPQQFRFDIMYEDAGKGQKRFLDGPPPNFPEKLKQRPLIQLFGLDNLNLQGDPGPDGIFDFVPGLTINLRSGRIMFPKLEPFGSYLRDTLLHAGAAPEIVKTYAYNQLYDSTLFRAREFQELNRFTLKGSYKSSTSAEISLGTFNLPQGSVRVSAGGQQLREGVDYQVDYNIGKVKILNDAILQSGQNVNVSFEDNTLFGFQNRTMIGTRFDYAFSKNFNVGATFMNLFERPLTQKVNFGDDPINNKVYGLDFNISKDAPWLTKLVDKLPLIETKEPSSITAQAEVAILDPGYSKAINQGNEKGGTVYLDDFEGSTSNLPLTIPANSWVIASVPQGDEQLFPESKDTTLALGANRAALSWYIADPSARDGNDADDPYTSLIQYQDIFPNRQLTPLEQSSLRPLDVTFYPDKRGPYNFEVPDGYIDTLTGKRLSEGLTIDGKLNKPETRWAGFMRGLNTNDFEAANIEFIEFWVLNPYMDKKDGDPVSQEGSVYFDLGTISEDIMRDSRQFFENALPTSAGGGSVKNTRWGRVPFEPPVVNAFDNDPARRPLQDLGLDGLNDEDEKTYFGDWYNIIMNSSLSPNAKAEITADPSNDNFVYFRDQIYESNPPGLLTRYSKFNNQQGNSPVNNSANLNPSATNLPDGEDLNLDRSLNENESYYRYPIKMTKGKNRIQVGASTIQVDGLQFEDDPILKDLITDTVVFNRNGQYYIWYRFKLPLDFVSRQQFGGIQDFRSIRFMRMVMKGFNERTTFRFATLELGRNQWRRYTQTLKGCGSDDPTVKRIPFDVNAVSIEENSARTPFNYTIPYGIQREQSVGAFPDVLQNEQALAMSVCDLDDCDARAIFKSLNLDLRQFKNLKMFVHLEAQNAAYPMDSTDVKAFLRIGSDFVRNYYEYEIPLDPSRIEELGGNRNPDSREYKEVVWKPKNSFDFPLELLIDVKKQRNLQPNWPATKAYEIVDPNHPANKVRVVGNPNLGYAKGVMFGVRNSPDAHPQDKQCLEVWINELRLNGFSEQGGYAGQARVDMKLADLGNVSLAGSFTSKGWGSIEQKINQRQREDVVQVDVSTNLELHKLLPEKAGVRIPFYAQYSNTTRTPEYDPYDLDIKLRDKLRDQTDPVKRDSIRNAAQDVTVVRGYNFTNVRKERRGNKKVSLPWDISNFSLTYAYNQTKKHNPFILLDQLDQRKGAIDYQYSTGLKPFTPFKKLIKKDKYLKFLSEFNFNPIPNTYGFNTNLERFAGKTTYRFAGEDPKLNTYYNRRFTWDRNYDLGWDIAKSLRFNFDATARSLIDEPYAFDNDGNVVSQKVVRDSIWKNVLKLGRPKNYTHNASLNYTLPFKTIPFMDFITVKASYTAGYTWTAQSLKLQNLDAGQYQDVVNSRNLGNVIQNNSVRQINGDMDFTKLYDKSKYLAKINKPGKPASGGGKGKPGKGGANDPGGSNPDNMDPGGLPDKGGRTPVGGGKDMRPGGVGKGKDSVSGGGGGKGSDQLNGASGKDNPTTPPDKNAAKNNLPAGGNNGLNPAIDPATGRPAANPNAGGLNSGSTGQPGNSSDPNDKGGKTGKDDKSGKGGGNLKGGKDKKERIPTLAERIALRPLMLVRKARFTYSENFSTVVPGFTPDAKLLGQSNGFSAPGWAFIAGVQPSSSWLDESAQNGWMTYRPELNQQVLRNYTQNMDGGVTVEPFTDFRVEITANRQYMRNSTELFKDQNFNLSPDSIDFQHRAARDFGSFTVSYFSMNTLFNNDINGLFKRYEAYRPIISQRLGVLAGDTSPHEDPNYANGYTKGRGGTHQEVLVPAFVAAYTDKDPNSVGLDLFKTRPALNWKLSYNGLSKVGKLSKVFSSVQITHGYKNTLTVNSYNTDIFYDPANPYDTNSDNYKLNYNYIARYEIPQVVVNEQMQPLLGLDVKLKNDMTFKADFKKSRMLALSLVDYQLAETRSSGYTVGFGYRVKNVNIKFLTGKKSTKGKKTNTKKKNAKKPAADKAGAPPPPTGGAQQGNDLNFKFDFDLRDDITINHRLDVPGDAIPTRGARTISINPSVEYALNKRLKLRLFTNYRKTVPKTSQSFPITTIQSGITVQFSLN